MVSNININGNTSFIDTTRVNENVLPQKQLTENKTPSIGSIQENIQEKVDMHINKNLTTATPTTGPSVDTVTAQMKPTGDRIHPHLKEEFTDPINQIFNPKEINGTQNEQAIMDGLEGILKNFQRGDKEGDIDFTKLGLDPKTIKKNQIQGKVCIDDKGKFQVKVTGYLGDDLRSAFIALKDNVGIAAKKSGLQNPITLDPNVLGKPSEPDRQVMERGGQIQYRALEGNKTLKLVLDPGKDGKDDGLTVSVLADYRGNEIKSIKTSAKIPLSVVFEGQELGGKKTDHPLLADWRTNRYFERAEIKTEWFFSHKTSDNANSVDRTQAQNDLWKGVNEYLKWSVEQMEEYGSIDTSEGGVEKSHIVASAKKGKRTDYKALKKWADEAGKLSDKIRKEQLEELLGEVKDVDLSELDDLIKDLENQASSENTNVAKERKNQNFNVAIPKPSEKKPKNNKVKTLLNTAKELSESIKKVNDSFRDEEIKTKDFGSKVQAAMQSLKEHGMDVETGNFKLK